jgi:hypothetical protein
VAIVMYHEVIARALKIQVEQARSVLLADSERGGARSRSLGIEKFSEGRSRWLRPDV